MTGSASHVGERLAGDGEELPVVAGGVQRQLQDGRPEREQASAAHAHDELADPVDRVGQARRGLRREPLVVMIMAVEHEVRSPVVQGLPQGPHRSVLQGPGAEERMMEVGERAAHRVRCEVGAQPLFLG